MMRNEVSWPGANPRMIYAGESWTNIRVHFGSRDRGARGCPPFGFADRALQRFKPSSPAGNDPRVHVGGATSYANPFSVFLSTSFGDEASRIRLLPPHQRRCRPQELAWHAGECLGTEIRFGRWANLSHLQGQESGESSAPPPLSDLIAACALFLEMCSWYSPLFEVQGDGNPGLCLHQEEGDRKGP